MIDNCLFQGPNIYELGAQIYTSSTNTMIRNSSFQDCYIVIRKAKAVLVDVETYNSHFFFLENSDIMIGKQSKFISSHKSAINVISSNITFSGKLSFSNNSDVYGGAMFLYLSNLIILPNAYIVFDNNSAQNCGGAMLLSSSNLYITAVHMDVQTVCEYIPGPYAGCKSITNEYSSPYKYTTPIFLNMTLLMCPQGFALLDQTCDCYLRNVLLNLVAVALSVEWVTLRGTILLG